MVHARVSEDYINFTLIYMADHILPVLPIKDLINEDGDLTRPYKLATGMKPSILNLRVLFFPCVVRKATTHFGAKALNMRHQERNGFCGIFFVIPEHQKGYIVYVPQKWKILSL